MQSSPPDFVLMINFCLISEQVLQARLKTIEGTIYEGGPPVHSFLLCTELQGLYHELDEWKFSLSSCQVQRCLFKVILLVDVRFTIVQEILKEGFLTILGTDMQDSVTSLNKEVKSINKRRFCTYRSELFIYVHTLIFKYLYGFIIPTTRYWIDHILIFLPDRRLIEKRIICLR